MKTLDIILHELLLSHECVIIPNFGGFLAQRKGSFIDFEKGTIIPPSKKLQFNIQLRQNDGILVNAYKLGNALSYDESLVAIEDKVVNWKAILSSGNTLRLNQIGTLWKDPEGNIQFEQDRNSNLLLSAFGLEIVHFVPQEATLLPAAEDLNPTQHHQAWRYLAAAVIALPIVFYSYWIPNETNAVASGIITIEDLNPFRKPISVSHSQAIKAQPKIPVKVQTPLPSEPKEITNAAPITEAVPKVVEVSPSPVVMPVPIDATQKAPTVTIPLTFHCIAGCFVNPENAISFSDKLTALGFQVQTFKEKGLHKVSIGNGFSREAVLEIQRKASLLNIESWILEKIDY